MAFRILGAENNLPLEASILIDPTQNATLVSEGDNVYALYIDTAIGNYMYVSKYNRVTNKWVDIGCNSKAGVPIAAPDMAHSTIHIDSVTKKIWIAYANWNAIKNTDEISLLWYNSFTHSWDIFITFDADGYIPGGPPYTYPDGGNAVEAFAMTVRNDVPACAYAFWKYDLNSEHPYYEYDAVYNVSTGVMRYGGGTWGTMDPANGRCRFTSHLCINYVENGDLFKAFHVDRQGFGSQGTFAGNRIIYYQFDFGAMHWHGPFQNAVPTIKGADITGGTWNSTSGNDKRLCGGSLYDFYFTLTENGTGTSKFYIYGIQVGNAYLLLDHTTAPPELAGWGDYVFQTDYQNDNFVIAGRDQNNFANAAFARYQSSIDTWTFTNLNPTGDVTHKFSPVCIDVTTFRYYVSWYNTLVQKFTVLEFAEIETYDFILSPVSGNIWLPVQFVDISIADAGFMDEWIWDFGDGETSTAQNPIHIYKTPGVFTITMQIHNTVTGWHTVTHGSSGWVVGSGAGAVTYYLAIFGGDLKVSITDKCYRMALMPDQGIGVTRYTGNWIFPESRVGTVRILDIKNRPAWIIMDSETGLPYIMSNRDGPTGGDLAKIFTDKTVGGVGTEIPSSVTMKKIKAPQLQDIEHEESQMALRPYDPDNAGATGYTDGGQRTAQQITTKVYADQKLAVKATARNIPEGAQISLDKKVEAQQIQIKHEFAASEYRVTGLYGKYNVKDRKGAPPVVIMSEQNYSAEFTNNRKLWVSRTSGPYMCRATGLPLVGTCSLVTGPEGKTDSGILFGAGQSISKSLTSDITGDFTISFFIRDIGGGFPTCILSSIGTMGIDVVAGAPFLLTYTDAGGGPIGWNLAWTDLDWVHLAIVRRGGTIEGYENGALINIQGIGPATAIGGLITLMNPPGFASMFDVQILDYAVSPEAIAYYYDDIANHEGNEFLPAW